MMDGIVLTSKLNCFDLCDILKLKLTTYSEVLKTIHPHPTLSEAISEATADAFDEAIHI